MEIKINSVHGSLRFEGEFASIRDCVIAAIKAGVNLRDVDLRGADLRGVNLRDVDLYGADLRCVDLRGVDLRCVDLRCVNLRGANLCRVDLYGADLRGTDLRGAKVFDEVKVEKLRIFSGLYKYEIWALLATNGTRYVRMGCLFRSLEEWDKVSIRHSSPMEFPDDRSEESEERVIAFEFAKAAALRLTK